MAIKHLKKYYLEVQNQYFEMLNDVRDLDEAYENHLIEENHYNQAIKLVERLGENYNRLSYVMLLLNKPTRDKKGNKYDKENREIYEYLSTSSHKHIMNDNDNVLSELKKLIKDGKKNGV